MEIKVFNVLTLTEQKRKEAVQAASNLTQALVDRSFKCGVSIENSLIYDAI